MKLTGKRAGQPQRPIMNANVIQSLATLAATVAATNETEQGLRYLRALVAFEQRPETLARKAAQSAKIQASKAKRKESANA